MALIGIDVGGTGIKAAAFSRSGVMTACAYREYVLSDGDQAKTLDPIAVWQAAQEVLREAVYKCGGEVEAICACSMGEMFVRFDEKGEILGKCITYHDRRGQELYDEFISHFGLSAVQDVLKVKPAYIQSLHRLRLLQQCEPELMKRTKKICFMSDFILTMLGAEHFCDWSVALTTSFFDFDGCCWYRPFLEWAGIDESVLPTPVRAGSVVGEVSPRIAQSLGIVGRAKLVVGPNDQIACQLGIGAHSPGDIYNGIGTVDCIVTYSSDPAVLERVSEYGIFTGLHSWPDTYILNTGAHYAGGAVLTWFREHFGLREKELWRGEFYAKYDKLIPREPTDLLVVCNFSGKLGDPSCKGAILNLTMDTTNAQIYRAFMEGETFEARTRIDMIRAAGLPAELIKTVGGASRSSEFMSIRADNFRLPVAVSDCPEPGTLGCAILGGVASGEFSSIGEATESMVHVSRIYEPSDAFTEKYDEMYEKFKRTYDALKQFS